MNRIERLIKAFAVFWATVAIVLLVGLLFGSKLGAQEIKDMSDPSKTVKEDLLFTHGKPNGMFWRTSSESEKLHILIGFRMGSESVNDLNEEKHQVMPDASLRTIMEMLDSFYRKDENSAIPIKFGVFAMGVQYESGDLKALDEGLKLVRKWAAAPEKGEK